MKYDAVLEALSCRSDDVSKSAYCYLNFQKAEIEDLESTVTRLNSRSEQLSYVYDALSRDVENRERRALENFAKKLKASMRLEDDCNYDCEHCSYSCKEYVPLIDKLLEELAEDVNKNA